MTIEPSKLESQGKTAFKEKKFSRAAELFRQAAHEYTLGRSGIMAAEMMNNASVALLQAGNAQESLDAALGTEDVFAGTNDIKRQAMALGNQAAALDALQRYDEALEKYELSAQLFGQADEGDLRAMVMKSAAAVKLKTGKITDSAFKMLGSLDAKETPSIFERILRFLLNLIGRA